MEKKGELNMSLSAFLNPVKYENKKVVISKRFVDENGNAEEWELQPLNENEVEKIRKAAGANVKQADNASKEQYMSELCAKCEECPTSRCLWCNGRGGAFKRNAFIGRIYTTCA